MFRSQFEGLAEIEAFRAGFKPSSVASPYRLPRLAPLDTESPGRSSHRRGGQELDIRDEMERRVAAHLERHAGR